METKENEKLLALTKLIGRKDLSFGCEIQLQFPNKDAIKDYKTFYLGSEDDEDSCMGAEFHYCYSIHNAFPQGESPDTIRYKYEIIGHPLLLSDILNGLSSKLIIWDLERSWKKLDVGYIYIRKEGDEGKEFEIVLGKPYFSDQSEEFKNFIYEAFNIK